MKRLGELFWAFFRIGALTFGGGYAMIALLDHECVEKRQWLTADELMDITVVAESTPGPIAINAATFVGIRIAGPMGAVVATLGCVFPSCLVVSLLAWVYFRYRQLTAIHGALYGLRPAVVALIASAGLTLLLTALWGENGFSPTWPDPVAVVLCLGAFFVLRRFKPDPILVMLACGGLGAAAYLLIPGLGG